MTDAPRTEGGPPRRILLATDLSARCDRALDRAAALATAWQAELVAVHARETWDSLATPGLERRPPSWERLSDPAGTAEAQLRRDLSEAAPGVVSAVVEPGDPADLVLRVARAQGCRLIVTGIARDETFGRYGLGTTVDRLLRRSEIPLLIVRQRARAAYGRVVVATDFSPSSRHALKVATAFWPGLALTLLHAHEAPDTALSGDPADLEAQHREAAMKEGVAFLAAVPDEDRRRLDLLVEPGHPADLVPRYVRDRGSDLVVLATHGRSAVFDIFIGSTAKDILSAVSCDALVVRAPEAPVEA